MCADGVPATRCGPKPCPCQPLGLAQGFRPRPALPGYAAHALGSLKECQDVSAPEKGDQDMSAKSLAKLAVERDTSPPGKSVVDDSTDALVAAVPTEALAAYTAVVGVVLAANIGSAYAPFRWCAYAT